MEKAATKLVEPLDYMFYINKYNLLLLVSDQVEYLEVKITIFLKHEFTKEFRSTYSVTRFLELEIIN